jgi:hypothetical protein
LPTNFALRFNPSAAPQFVLFPSASNLNFGLDMTIEFWIRTTSTYGGLPWYDAQWILDKDIEGEGRTDWAVVLRSGRIVFSNGGGVCCTDRPLYGVQPVNDGNWHHVAIVRNVSGGNGLTQLYIDGNLDTSSTLPPANLSNTLGLVIGVEYSTAPTGLSHALRGDLDDLRLWNVARTQSQIRADMVKLAIGNEPGLVGYWRFNEGNGQIAFDQTSYGVNGQLGSTLDPESADPAWILAPELYNGLPTPTPTSAVGPPVPLP